MPEQLTFYPIICEICHRFTFAIKGNTLGRKCSCGKKVQINGIFDEEY